MAGVSAETVTVFRIGSFNVGVDQDMLTGRELAAQERRLANNGRLVICASASQPSANSAETEVGRQPVDQQRHNLVMHQEVIEEVQEELTFSWIERNGCLSVRCRCRRGDMSGAMVMNKEIMYCGMKMKRCRGITRGDSQCSQVALQLLQVAAILHMLLLL